MASPITTHDVEYFDASKIRNGAAILIVGMRGSGKSTVTQTLLYFKRHFTHGVCISATERLNKFWGNTMPAVFISDDPDPSLIAKLMSMQLKIRTNPGIEPEKWDAFLLLDDCLFDHSIMNSKVLRQLLLNGRHSNITTFVTAQYAVGIPKMLRVNFDYIFLLPAASAQTRMSYFEQFGGMCKSYEEFESFFEVCTQDRGVMVIDQGNPNASSISQLISWWTPTLDLKYRMGHPAFWTFQRVQSGRESSLLDMMRIDRQHGSAGNIRVIRKYPAAEPATAKKKKGGADDPEANGQAPSDMFLINGATAPAQPPIVLEYEKAFFQTAF